MLSPIPRHAQSASKWQIANISGKSLVIFLYFACIQTLMETTNWPCHFCGKCVGMSNDVQSVPNYQIASILGNRWLVVLVFCMQSNLDETYQIISSFLLAMVRHLWCPKFSEITNYQCIRRELNDYVSLLYMQTEIHGSYIFIMLPCMLQYFQRALSNKLTI